MSLYIGAYYPDRQLDESLFGQALVKVAAGLAQYRQHPLQMSAPNLDIHFMMPGKEESPNFEGMRLRFFDRQSSTLRIESAVPDRMVNSMHSEAYILAVMQDAVDNAADFFDEQQLSFKHQAYLDLVNQLETVESAPIRQVALS